MEENEELEQNLELEENEELYEEDEYFEEQYERTKPIGKLIMLVAFTAIMLVSSTYAWFSAQKSITIGNIEGTVNVAEGLMVSLDANNWSQEINLKDPTLDAGRTLANPYEGGSNVIPTEMLPVSATGVEDIGENTEITYYTGTNVNMKELYDITTAETNDGYYAIDLFLQNSSKIDTTNGEEQGVTTEALQLNTDSLLQLLTSGTSELTGLQNIVRVGLAMYNYAEGTDLTTADRDEESSIYITATQEQILAAYEGTTIKDIAIWEPNASEHVDYIVTNNNEITWGSNGYVKDLYIADSESNGKFTGTEMLPTYALTEASTSANEELTSTTSDGTARRGIADIYNWAATDTYEVGPTGAGLERQIALQTKKSATDYTINDGGVRNLVSVTSDGDVVYELGNEYVEGNEDGTITFEMLKNSIIKVRLYVWLEGQDVDCTTYASHGGGIHLDIGLIKGVEVGSGVVANLLPSTAETTPYLPTTFSYDGTTDLSTGLTIEDSAQNEYVWVEVPRSTTIYDEAGLSLDLDNLTGTELTNAYNAIAKDLHDYTGKSDTDIHSGDDTTTGLTSTQYTELKQKMLKSVYENGGFYIGKYETGTATVRDYGTDFTTEHPITETPIIQANAYPYAFVTAAQAQTLATRMSSGEYTSSLIFDIQWDLTLKYLETKGVSSTLLYDDSTSWGNYANSEFTIEDENVKYNVPDGDTIAMGEWLPATAYTHNVGDVVGLTTGASSTFSKMGIYDLAGNAYEWSLGFGDSTNPCVYRGGGCGDDGSNIPADVWFSNETGFSIGNIGFRVALY